MRHILSVAAAFLLAIAPARPQQQQPTLRSTSELVKIDVTVLDNHGNYIPNLTQQDFRVLDNSVPAAITYFAPVESPAEVLVLVETSPAVYLIQNQHLAAAYALLQGLRPDDEVALISYDSAPHPLLAFTSDKSSLLQALGQLGYFLGSAQLNFFDSLSTSIDWLAPAPGKKAIVLLTTGLDSSPPNHREALLTKLRASEVVLYPVALGGQLRQPAKKTRQPKKSKPANPADDDGEAEPNPLSFKQADTDLTTLASVTGGQAYFPSSLQDFQRIYSEIATILRHQYVLGITPAHDNQFHSITVEVIDAAATPPATTAPTPEAARPNLRLFHRQGYQAPSP